MAGYNLNSTFQAQPPPPPPPRNLYSAFREQPPPPPVSGIRRLEPTEWVEIPLIPDPRDLDGLPRKVYARVTSNGNLEVGIEATKALEALRAGYRAPTSPAPLPAGFTETERAKFHRQHQPRESFGKGGGGTEASPTYGTLPESEAPSLRLQRLALLQRQRLKLPLIPARITELPLSLPGRPAAPTTQPERRAFATALVPAAALHAVNQYVSLTRRRDQEIVRAVAYALFSARFTASPTGRYTIPPRGQVTSRVLYHGGVTGESYVPGTFPPGYSFSPLSAASVVPVTTDTIAAAEYFVRIGLRGAPLRGRGQYRTYSPPRRNRIANDLTASGWRVVARTPGFNVNIYAPPSGPAPKD